MADFYENNGGMNDVVSGVEPVKKRTGAVIGGITAGVLVVAVGGGFAAYATSDFVKNQVKLRLSKPESYYSWVTEKNSSEFASQVADCYRDYLEKEKNGQTAKAEIKYEPSDTVKTELISAAGEDEMVSSIVNNVKSISLGCDWMAKQTLSSGNIYAALNGDKLVSVDASADAESGDVLFRIPEVSEQWVIVNDVIEMIGASEELEYKDPESIITPDELEQLVSKYSSLYANLIEDVQLEKKEEIAIDDITVNYSVVEVTLTEEKSAEIAIEMLNTIKDDELIRAIAVDRIGETTNEEFDEFIDDAISDVKESDGDEADTFVIRTYVDAKGDIRGMGMEVNADEKNEIYYIMGKDGDQVRGEMYSKAGGEEEFSGKLTLTEESDTYNGSLEMTADDATVKVDFIDLTEVDKDVHSVSGKVAVSVSNEGETYSVELLLNGDSTTQEFSTDLVFDEMNYGKITVSLSSEDSAEPVSPDKSGAYVLNEDSDFPTDYVDEATVSAYIKSLAEKIGLDADTAQAIADEAAASLYNSYSGHDDYDWDDDFAGWDDDDDFMVDTDDEDLFWSGSESEDGDNKPETKPIVEEDDDDDYLVSEPEAHVVVMDSEFNGYYGYESTTFEGKNAVISKDGKYTVSAKVLPDGFEDSDKKGPDGIVMLSVEAFAGKKAKNAEIIVNSVKIDGKEIKLAETPESSYDDGYLAANIYTGSFFGDDENDDSEFAKIADWTEVEVEFEVKGME